LAVTTTGQAARVTTRTARPQKLELWVAVAIGALSLVMLAVSIYELAVHWSRVWVGADYIGIMGMTQRWVETGVYYLPEQLAGPYDWDGPWVLYPPPSLILFVPFLYLPAILWWAIPIGITAWAVCKHRPRPLAWAVILFAIANPTTMSAVVWGNPGIWIVAAVALGTHYGWPAVFVFLKPSLFPFALIGIWRRSWWVALAACAVVSLAFLPMWFDWLTVIRNATPVAGLHYSITQVPMMLLPMAAWLGSTRGAAPGARWSWLSARRTAGDPAPQP
jgi:hypothetical protein